MYLNSSKSNGFLHINLLLLYLFIFNISFSCDDYIFYYLYFDIIIYNTLQRIIYNFTYIYEVSHN